MINNRTSVIKLIGYILIGSSAIGVLYFKTYKGSIIQYPTLWLIISIVVGVFGYGLIISATAFNETELTDANYKRQALIKNNSLRILLTLDNCTIKENNYYQQTAIKEKFTFNVLQDKEPTQEYIQQCVIVYAHKTDEGVQQLISQIYNINKQQLTDLITQNKISIYISNANYNDYIFE